MMACHFAPALSWATDLARNQKCQLLLVHVQEPVSLYSGGEVAFVVRSPLPIESMLDEFDPKDPTIECRHLAIEGDPAKEIVQLALRRNVRCIVLGTHGRTGVSRLLWGSVAEQLIRNAGCPVIVLKQNSAVPNHNSAAKTDTAGLVVQISSHERSSENAHVQRNSRVQTPRVSGAFWS